MGTETAADGPYRTRRRSLVVCNIDCITHYDQLGIRTRALHQRLPSSQGDAGDAHVVAGLAGVHEVIMKQHHDAARHAADAKVLHLLLDLDLLVIPAHLAALDLAERLAPAKAIGSSTWSPAEGGRCQRGTAHLHVDGYLLLLPAFAASVASAVLKHLQHASAHHGAGYLQVALS